MKADKIWTSSCSSSSDEDHSSDIEPEKKKRKVVRHALAQRTHLEYLFKSGMNSCSKDRIALLQNAAKETGLTIDQVKRWIKKRSYRQKHAKIRADVNTVAVKRKLTPWQLFQKEFGKSDDGKDARKVGAGSFISAASQRYYSLEESEKNRLKEAAEGGVGKSMSTAERRRKGARIFKKIEKQMEELHAIGFKGVAYGFLDNDVQLAYTPDCTCCADHRVIDFIRSVIVVDNAMNLPTTSSSFESASSKTGLSEASKSASSPAEASSASGSSKSVSTSAKTSSTSALNKSTSATAKSASGPTKFTSAPSKSISASAKTSLASAPAKSTSKPASAPSKSVSASAKTSSASAPSMSTSKSASAPSKSVSASAKTSSASAPSKSTSKSASAPSKSVSAKTLSASAPPQSMSVTAKTSSVSTPIKSTSTSTKSTSGPTKTFSALASIKSASAPIKSTSTSAKSASGSSKSASGSTKSASGPTKSASGPTKSASGSTKSVSGPGPAKTSMGSTSTSSKSSTLLSLLLGSQYAGHEVSRSDSLSLAKSAVDSKDMSCSVVPLQDKDTVDSPSDYDDTPSPVVPLQDSIIVLSSSPVKQDNDTWLVELNLTTRDREILQSSEWLNDAHINAAQCLLQKQSEGKIMGWQSPQRAKRKALFTPIPPQCPFAQILHVNNSHWVVVSNIDLHNPNYGHHSTIQVYDSFLPLTKKVIDAQTRRNICSLMKSRDKELVVQFINVESQLNSCDCGLHAIAAATELVFGKDPSLCAWDNNHQLMRHHLLSCFIKQTMSRFPTTKQRRIGLGGRVKRIIRIEVFCVCRMPWDRDSNMIECGMCKEWFHLTCLGMDEEVDYSDVKWMCDSCANLLKN